MRNILDIFNFNSLWIIGIEVKIIRDLIIDLQFMIYIDL